MDNLSLLEKFANPDLMQKLSIGEKMLASLYVMVLGMAVTFVALCILWGLIVLMSKMINSTKKEATKVVQAPEKTIAPAVEVEKEEKENEEELVAVITAAIAASLQTSTHNIVVRNITRVKDITPAWGRMGRIEQMNSRF
ncbi:sodium pump decarboxylase subunit gamma [Crassaminicella thermophila]|uniref:Sodium pump decarboxylase subunit gamma n=1 Tax=Crassaminicella thermophila TaxID=2599308 RepID=A0A5C0SD12_CRATE|nr:OadG family protein [Crassaminicella thermophila]QEK11104.1 sodium pump decarboxylase subunit gamma [Crassaminicella thermophila]